MSVEIIDTATPELQRIAGLIARPRGLMAAASKRVERDLRSHFAKKDREGNAKGWPRSHFWAKTVRAATSVSSVTDSAATVTVASSELVHKIKGGRVTPKRGKFLAIPATARAKAAGSPREGGIPGLFFIARRVNSKRYLAIQDGGALRIMYRLLPYVDHRADPTAVPSQSTINQAVDDEAGKYLARALRRQGGVA